MNTAHELLERLAGAIRAEILTPAKAIDCDTFFCITEATPQGIAYHQGPFDTLNDSLKEQFRGKEVGQKIGSSIKVVAVYHIWEPFGPSVWGVKKP